MKLLLLVKFDLEVAVVVVVVLVVIIIFLKNEVVNYHIWSSYASSLQSYKVTGLFVTNKKKKKHYPIIM